MAVTLAENDLVFRLGPYLQDQYPLHKAAREGQLDVIQELVRLGYAINTVNFDQVTPLHEACFFGHYQCAQFFVQHDAIVDARSIDGSTPLCEASAMGRVDCIMLLLQYGARVNPPLALCSPLHEAVIRSQVECTDVLIKAGAKLDVSDCHYGTPLHAACFRNGIGCARLLLQAGASVNATKIHRTALHIAAHYNFEAMTALLLKFGANVYLTDNNDKRPSQLAPPNSHLANILREYETKPRDLRCLCKLEIRKILGPTNLNYVGQLGLPTTLVDYVYNHI